MKRGGFAAQKPADLHPREDLSAPRVRIDVQLDAPVQGALGAVAPPYGFLEQAQVRASDRAAKAHGEHARRGLFLAAVELEPARRAHGAGAPGALLGDGASAAHT